MPFFDRLAVPDAVQRFIEAEDLDAEKAVVEQFPVLLSDAATVFLEKLTEVAKKTPGAEAFLGDKRRLLTRCREIGTDAAVDEQRIAASEAALTDALAELVTSDSVDELRVTLAEHPELLDRGEAALTRISEDMSDYGADRIDALRTLLRRAKEIGVDAALGEHQRLTDEMDDSSDVVSCFLSATPEEETRMLEEHPVLRSREVLRQIDAMLEAFAAATSLDQESQDFAIRLKAKRTLLATQGNGR
jgi:RNA polymerase-binding transcription factor DksA